VNTALKASGNTVDKSTYKTVSWQKGF